MPKELERAMTREVITRMAEGNESTKLREIIREVIRKKEYEVRPESYPYFSRQVQNKFFSWLDTNTNEWRLFPGKARRYLGIPETPIPQPRPVVLRKQEGLPF